MDTEGVQNTGLLTFGKPQLPEAKERFRFTPAPPGDGHETALSLALSAYVSAATAQSTRRAYRCDLDHFLAWGGSVPCSPELVAAYLAAHAESLKASTLRRRAVAIGLAHTAQGLESPCKAEIVRVTLRGICRVHGIAQSQAAPAVREDILAMVRGLTGTKGIRDSALLLLGFAGAFRRSELVGLNISDLEFVDRGLIVHLRRSKTDQEGLGRKVAIPYARGSTCPVKAVQEWLTLSGISEGSLFRPVTRHGHIAEDRLSGHAVAQVVKARAAAAGLNAVDAH